MSTEKDFSKDEWLEITNLHIYLGTAVVALNPGVVSFLKALEAQLKNWVKLGAMFEGDELIQAIKASSEASAAREADGTEPRYQNPRWAASQLEPRRVMDDVRRTLAIVDARASASEAKNYRTYLYSFAECAAQASGSGFLGMGEKLSENEREFLALLKATLGI